MHEKGRTMQINSAAQMRQAIIDLAERVQQLEELQAIDTELASQEPQRPLPALVEPSNDEQAYAREVEAMVIGRIASWKYAQRTPDGGWNSPISASRVAENMGNKTQWPLVKALMRRTDVWKRLRWYHAPPPQGWRSGDPNARAIQWVEVTPA